MDSSLEIKNNPVIPKEFVAQKLTLLEKILSELEKVSKLAKDILSQNVCNNGKIDNALLEKFQHEAHGFAWFETYRFSLRETLNWYLSLKKQQKESELESSILVYAFSEYLNQMRHGIMISQSEVVRPSTLGSRTHPCVFIKVRLSPGFPAIFSTEITSSLVTLYCFPPVSIIANTTHL